MELYTHRLILRPWRQRWAYSKGLSIARAFRAHFEQGVVFRPFCASQLSSLRRYPVAVSMSILLWCILQFKFQLVTCEYTKLLEDINEQHYKYFKSFLDF